MTSNNDINTKGEITDAIITELQKRGPVRPEGKGWRTRCPNPDHEDNHPSFFLNPDGSGQCFSRCNRHWSTHEPPILSMALSID
ncbi:hypothetical protein ACFLUS_01035 [Chloroflexota bacterium]